MEGKIKENLNIFSILSIIAVLLAALAYFDKSGTQNIITSSGNAKTITLNGESERFVSPDTASVNFSMTKKSKSTTEASDSVNTRVKGLLDALKGFGVEEKDIKTTNYSLRPEYTYPRNTGQRVFDGYRVTQNLTVKIRELDNASEILTKIGELEVDNLSGLNFFVDNDDQIRDELRSEAIEDAKDKAKELGRELGVNLTKIVGFSEGSNYNYQPIYSKSYALESADFGDIAPANIPAGENQMTGRVSVTFEIN